MSEDEHFQFGMDYHVKQLEEEKKQTELLHELRRNFYKLVSLLESKGTLSKDDVEWMIKDG